MMKQKEKIKKVLDKNGREIGKLEDIRYNNKKEIIEISVTKPSLLKNFPAIVFERKEFKKIEDGIIWLNITREKFNTLIRKLFAEKKDKAKKARIGEVNDEDKALTEVFKLSNI
jgi:sporulation protein YlmC with PRC-barrel domain